MKSKLSRRQFLQTSGGVLVTASAAQLFPTALLAQQTLKIGYVTPRTGPLAPFAESDVFVIEAMQKLFANGIEINGSQHAVEILVKDSQSDPNRAADVAAELILDDEVHLMLVSSTPETTNPVGEQCEVNEVPCISTVAPWQPWFFTRGGDPATGFDWTYHFFWGLEDIIAVFNNLWSRLDTNKAVGGMWPNDGDGNAWSDPKLGFPPVLQENGYTVVDPGRYQNLTDDFSAQINAFKSQNVEIVTGVMIPPDFTTFWTQAAQQGFKPKAATIGKALLFPVAVEALGPDAGHNLSTEVWWTPNHPFQSSLTGQSAQELAAAYQEGTGKQWTQPLGFAHALFEIAVDVFKRTEDLDDPASIRDALAATRLDTIVGTVDWSAGPVKNVAKTPLVGGQWRKGSQYPYDLVVVDNQTAPDIPTQGEIKAIA